MTMKVQVGVALVCGLGLGVGIGWAARGPGEVAPAQTFAPAAAVEVKAPEPPAAPPTHEVVEEMDEATCVQTLGKIQTALAQAQQDKQEAAGLAEHLDELLLKSGGASRDGVKQPWPDVLDVRYLPEGFTAAVEEIKKACPKEFPPGTRADCSEFPCALQLVHPGAGRDWDGMKTCKKFNELLGDNVSWSSHGGKGLKGEELAFSHIVPLEEEGEVKQFMQDYEGNLQKRRRVRSQAFQREQRQQMFEGPCVDGSEPAACQQAANAYKDSDPGKRASLLGRGCELGDAQACNNVAWEGCHDQGVCDDEALRVAERAAELAPDDGKGALDTLAFVLCKTGRKAEANAAYERSCKAGYADNCGKQCAP